MSATRIVGVAFIEGRGQFRVSPPAGAILPHNLALKDHNSGRLHRSLRCHLAFISANAEYPRFFKASSTPSISRS
jgi:hypothetical protein